MSKMRRFIKQYQLRQIAACFLVLCMLINTPVVLALSDADVSSTINATVIGDGTVTVNVLDTQAVVNWTDLDTVDSEVLEFIKDGGGFFAVLNRVVDNPDPTLFNGTLIGNQGHIIIVNPNGIVFGGTADISAAMFTASALDLDPDYFMNPDNANQLLFTGGDGYVHTEEGSEILAQQVALLGKEVRNAGTILSPGGLVLMATGDSILLGTEGSDVIVEIDIDAVSEISENGSGDIYNEATGVVDVSNPDGSAGTIILAAGDSYALPVVEGLAVSEIVDPQGNIHQKGVLNASGIGGDGGDIHMTAVEDVLIYEGSSTTTDAGTEGAGGNLYIAAYDNVDIKENLTSGADMEIEAGSGVYVGNSKDITAGEELYVYTDDFGMIFEGDLQSCDGMILDSGTSIFAFGDITGGDDVYICAHNGFTYSEGDITAADNLTLDTDLILGGGEWVPNTDINYWVWEGDQTLEATDGKLTSYGYIEKWTPGQLFITGGGMDEGGLSVDLQYNGDAVSTWGNMYIYGEGDVQISGDLNAMEAGNYYLPEPPSDELYQLWPITRGGVSVISETGKIYTRPDEPSRDGYYELSINIMGYSDDTWDPFYYDNPGVDLPYTDEEGNPLGKAAIVLMSEDTLRIGEDSHLSAYGNYLPMPPEGEEDFDYEGIGVDDRPAINFLDEEANIGGYDRDPGIPIDVAVYLASTAGDVEVHIGNIQINPYITKISTSYLFDGYRGMPTVVLDAYDTVRFTDLEGVDNFTDMLLMLEGYSTIEDYIYDECCCDTLAEFLDYIGYDSFEQYAQEMVLYEYLGESYPFRLEVCSRITEWLNEAISQGTLPYADNQSFMEQLLGADYVLRGSGDFDHPGNDEWNDWEERAWVLEEMPIQETAPLPVLELPVLKGCPVEMQAVALELGITEETIQVYMSRALAMNADIQPCEACARLIEAAQILQDADGSRMAVLTQVFNELAPSDVPYTPEMSAMVASTLRQHAGDGTFYAQALEYLDAFESYVSILDTELGSPVGDSVAFVMSKHGDSISGSDNPNVTAFLAVQLETASGAGL